MTTVESDADLLLLDADLLTFLADEELAAYLDALDVCRTVDGDWHLQSRQQTAEDRCNELMATGAPFELLYGGAGGGGKSEWLLFHLWTLARRFPSFSGLLIRRSYKELERTAILRSLARFGRDGCAYNATHKRWTFDNGSIIEFGYCVAGDTDVLMADGSYRQMADVRVGDLVATLEGPRPVTDHWHVGVKPAVTLTMAGAPPVVASATHRVLGWDGAWRSPGRESVGTASHASTRGSPAPRRRFARLGLHGPEARRAGTAERGSARRDARGRAPSASSPAGSPGGCPTGTHSGGALPRLEPGGDRGSTLRRVGAGTRTRGSRSGGRVRTRAHSPRGVASYSHPYTTAPRPLAVDVLPASVAIAPAGDRDLWDMTVAGANHYVSRGGIVHQNCDRDVDVFQYDSAEYDCVAWDELTEFPTSYPYLYLFSRLRTSVGKAIQGLTPHVIAGTNPHRTGVAWVKPRWVELGEWEKVHRVETTLEDGTVRSVSRVFIPAKMSDNAYINEGAYRAALSLLDEPLRRAIEDGNWDVVEGQYFREWRRDLHVVRPFEIPSWWRRVGGLDYGYANPFAHEWAAFDGDGSAYVYREAYRRELTPREQAALILAAERGSAERIDYRVADPSIWTHTGAGPPIATQYLNAGMPCRRANNARIDGWARMRDYLRPQRRAVVNEDTKEEALLPRLFVFDTCTDLIRTLPLLVHDRNKPEDLDTDGEDHGADALRYLLMSVPLRSKAPESPESLNPDIVRDRGREARERARRGHADHPILGAI